MTTHFKVQFIFLRASYTFLRRVNSGENPRSSSFSRRSNLGFHTLFCRRITSGENPRSSTIYSNDGGCSVFDRRCMFFFFSLTLSLSLTFLPKQL
ncbi:hypothetical protein HanPI659440_Chr14g0552741 [Helianthus annuus]|nr:hypothetical protein HanPI659440_Chr14g0552741 [Helianthus annuus]